MTAVEHQTLLRTKLHRPPVTGDLISRPRLVAQLDRGLAGPLTLVCAPAGFGKTTLVSSWIEIMALDAGGGEEGITPSLPVAWLSLDSDDSNPVVFLRYFIGALRTIYADACTDSWDLLRAPKQPPSEVILAALSNEIGMLPGRFVLVLDDYQAIGGHAVPDLLNRLLRHWPRPMHLVLISRLNPPLPLSRLRAKGQLVEIRTRDLRFTQEESAAYLRSALPEPLGEAEMVLLGQRVEGWIAGLRLASLSLRGGARADAGLAYPSGADADIADYLVDEVLSRQPPAIQAFLLRTSILDRFCASLCEAVAGIEDPGCSAGGCLDWVEQANLFVIPLDNRREWYRYHHLFRELLQRRLLTQASADQVSELHGKAAGWFASQGLVDEALHHALAYNDLDLAARLIEQGLRDVLNREDPPTLERWLRLLPEGFVQGRPGVLMLKAWALHFSWQLDALAKVLQQVEALIDADDRAAAGLRDPQVPSQLRAQIALLRAQQAYHRNRPADALACCQEALALTPQSWTYLRGGAMFYWGLSMRACGEDAAARRALLDQYESLTEKADAYALRLLFAVGHNSIEVGQLEQAKQTAQLMLDQATRSRLAVLQGWACYFLGMASYYRNELGSTAQFLEELVDRRHAIHAMAARNGMIGLVLVHLACGETSAAQQVVELLSRFDLFRAGYEPDDLRSLRARLYFLQGDRESAFRWADAYSTPTPDTPLAWLQDPYIEKARILLARGEPADLLSALSILNTLHEIAERTHSTRGRIEIGALRALALDALEQPRDAEAALRQAVELSRSGGFIRAFVDLGPSMAVMLSRLAAQDFAVETIRRILAAFRDAPHMSAPPSAPSTPASRKPEASPRTSAIVETLTKREYDVLLLLRERLSNKEIAQKLHLSTSTVKRHLVNIYGKLGVNRRWEAVIEAEALGILPGS